MGRREHWETVYQTRKDHELSWFQEEPGASLALIDSLEPAPRRVIDVGGGQSALAGLLLSRAVEEVTVLDISSMAIGRGRARLGERAARVRWFVADVLETGDIGQVDLWHDRAVFHFLTAPEDRRRYVEVATSAIAPGGHAIIATFAPRGPEKCSGLTVCRYDAGAIAAEFGEAFVLIGSMEEAHATPWGKTQDFTYAVLRRSTE